MLMLLVCGPHLGTKAVGHEAEVAYIRDFITKRIEKFDQLIRR